MTQVREALEPPQITMADVRKRVGDGMVSSDDVITAANGLLREHWQSLSAAPGEPCAVKPLKWRDHRPDSFPEPAWSAQTPFGFYNIEEVCASDSPAYVVRLHAHHFIADKDGLDEAKAAAQADYEQRIKSALVFEGRK